MKKEILINIKGFLFVFLYKIIHVNLFTNKKRMICFVEFNEFINGLYYDTSGDDMKRDIGLNKLMEMLDDLDLEIVKSFLVKKVIDEEKWV